MTKQQYKIHIGNISYRTTKETLEQEFASCGDITDVSLPLDKQTGKSRGFAFINFETVSGQKAALQKDGVKVDGRALRISEARPFEPRTQHSSYESRSTEEAY
ncbi:MAG: RNA-binding protein [Gammaproteobacteria bacterium]|nr:RNA-binding protein [Gammaproteobacteria bacterium]